MVNYYKILKVHEDASKEDIQEAYTKLSSEWYNDHILKHQYAAAEKRKLFCEAYNTLADDIRRKMYDQRPAGDKTLMHKPSFVDHYKVLKLHKNANIEDIKDAYKNLAKDLPYECKPENLYKDSEIFYYTSKAYYVLSDANKRQKHDEELEAKGRPNFYKVLNISKDAVVHDIEVAYAQLVVKWCQRVSVKNQYATAEKYKMISKACEVLTDPEKRRTFDSERDEKSLRGKVKAVDFYKVLDVPRNATKKDIQTAYEKRVKESCRYNPVQQFKAAFRYRMLSKAFYVLSDKDQRFIYDRTLEYKKGSNTTPDYYQILNVTKNTTAAEIKKSYLKLKQEYNLKHRQEVEKKYRLATEAYKTLSEEDNRQMYDKVLNDENCKNKVEDFYKILNVSRACEPEDVKKAYDELKLWYQDIISKKPYKVDEKYKLILKAFDVLSDETKRQIYDKALEAKDFRKVSTQQQSQQQVNDKAIEDEELSKPPTQQQSRNPSFCSKFYAFATVIDSIFNYGGFANKTSDRKVPKFTTEWVIKNGNVTNVTETTYVDGEPKSPPKCYDLPKNDNIIFNTCPKHPVDIVPLDDGVKVIRSCTSH